MYFIDMIIYFAIYSFLGWMIETIFASIIERKFINRGFLIGPFCPIYGFGAVMIILCSKWANGIFETGFTFYLIGIFISVTLATILEYITGAALEKFFNCKWWDYSDNALNLHGYICLKYSLLWGLLAFLMLQVIHPEILKIYIYIPIHAKIYFSIALIIYFFADMIKSVMDIIDLRKVILKYSDFTGNKYYDKIIEYKRIFLAFPRLMILNAGIVNRDVRSVLNGRINKIKDEIKSRFK
jgi:uncharacterized membrane protein